MATSSYSDDQGLGAELRALRPAPRPEFAAELDARVEAGFRSAPGGGSAPAGLLARLRSTPPRRLALPVGGVAVAAVVVATAVVTIGGAGGQGASPSRGLFDSGGSPAISPAAGQSAAPSSGEIEGAAESAAGTAGEDRSKAYAGAGHPLAESVPSVETDSVEAGRSGPYAAHHRARDIERGASIALSDDPSKVRADSAQVFEAVHAANGIVLHSAIRDGSSGDAGASFELLIPTARLGDAMAAFAGIAAVRARHESSQDITAPTLSAGERLQDSAARVKSLLAQLAETDTDAERAAVEARLRAERAQMANLRSRLAGLERRANLSHVTLRIETGAPAHGGAGPWGVGDGFDDAGRILAVAAGVSVIGLAAIAPLALLALLAWLARRAYLSRSRRAALARAGT